MKKIIAGMLATVLAVGLVGCGTTGKDTTKKEDANNVAQEEQKTDDKKGENDGDKVFRIATPGNYKPFTIYDETEGEFSGFEIDLWKEIAEKSGYEVDRRNTSISP